MSEIEGYEGCACCSDPDKMAEENLKVIECLHWIRNKHEIIDCSTVHADSQVARRCSHRHCLVSRSGALNFTSTA